MKKEKEVQKNTSMWNKFGSNLQILPIVIAVLMVGGISVTFYLAYIHFKHVTYLLPYISDTGTIPPESCIFGFVLNILSFLLGVAVYIKYLHVEEICKKHHISKNCSYNKVAIFVGGLTVLGINLVANFQETNAPVVHWSGAILCFVAGSLYLSAQTYIYIKISPVLGQRKTTMFRIFLSIVAVSTSVICVGTGLKALSEFTGEDVTKWQADDGGAKLHQISTNSEWICATALLIYILLFYKEFKDIVWEGPKIILVERITALGSPNITAGSSPKLP
ncbi:DNA damage-regulated autophagy modulator protein 1-like [Sitophilus oryzae]|uniref:DNA damage-regulated autophagy modulator protein 1-like n=1 Tax=Sitophilus oryzae TaxID=7048 RepID=A0A6J2YV66_SITOR|nr:DNA damage-regulated autophagy modulator protein 1-like [Sitophilus oryzae]